MDFHQQPSLWTRVNILEGLTLFWEVVSEAVLAKRQVRVCSEAVLARTEGRGRRWGTRRS